MSLRRRVFGFVFSDLISITFIAGYLVLDTLIFFKTVPEINKETWGYQILNYSVLIPILILGWKLFWGNKFYRWKISKKLQFIALLFFGYFVFAVSGEGQSHPVYNFFDIVFSIFAASFLFLISWGVWRVIWTYWLLLWRGLSGQGGWSGFKRRLGICFKVVFVLLAFGAFYQVYYLTNRLELVEERLGGRYKLACNEKDSIANVRKSVVRVVGGWSEGSGFAVKNGNFIITNFHVIEFEPSPKIIMPDNTFKTAEIILADKAADIAILRVDGTLPVVKWGNPYGVETTDQLLAVGFPFGGDLRGESTVNRGSLAGRRVDKLNGVEYLQTDATLNPGISGGPMINICGEVVGMNTMGTAGLGLAITSETIKSKWIDLAFSSDPLKDVEKITFEPEKGPLEAVEAFYNYIKVRKMQEAFGLLSDEYKGEFKFENWKKGYESNLDTSTVIVAPDPKRENFILVKLITKDLIGEDIVVKYFEGEWEVRNIDGKWLLWDPEIKEVASPDNWWFYSI